MIASWMLYALLVSALVSAAAVALEQSAAAFHAPRRWIWSCALALSVLAPVAASVFPSQRAPVSMTRSSRGYVPVSFSPRIAELPPRAASLDRPLLVLWLGASLFVFMSFGLNFGRLLKMRRGWKRTRVDGRLVYLSNDLGPAAVGFRQPIVVFPQWAVAMDEAIREVMLMHEAEHVRAGDSRLLLAARIPLVLMPWNPVLWWQLHRLRAAVEIDCDRRVLSVFGDPHRYGKSLLAVGRRMSTPALLGTGFSHTTSFLERRIQAMITTTKRWRWVQAVAFVGLASTALGAAWQAKRPAPVQVKALSNAKLGVVPDSLDVVRVSVRQDTTLFVEIAADSTLVPDTVVVEEGKTPYTRGQFVPKQDVDRVHVSVNVDVTRKGGDRPVASVRVDSLLTGRVAGASSIIAGRIARIPQKKAQGDYYLDYQVEKQAEPDPRSEPPKYPEVLRASGLEGSVEAQFIILADGTVDMESFKVANEDDANPLFIKSVKDAVSKMQFFPAQLGGRAVNQLVQQAFNFTLKK